MTTERKAGILDSINKPASGHDLFRREVVQGLRLGQKELPCKYLYDARGSALFERICTLKEYYIPEVEREIMHRHLDEIATRLGDNALLVEYGCGDCSKVRILLGAVESLSAFVPVDIASDQLSRVAGEMREEYPWLEVLPVCADFTGYLELPRTEKRCDRVVAYFPGSTIGNMHPVDAVELMRRIARTCGPGGALLIGVDLRKDPRILHRAYNDSAGLSAEFNLNLLRRINRELDGDFRLDRFEHYSFYNPHDGRVEMHLVSLEDQEVRLGGEAFRFERGESIWTESSYKYTTSGFRGLATRAGFTVKEVWVDRDRLFSIQYLECGPGRG